MLGQGRSVAFSVHSLVYAKSRIERLDEVDKVSRFVLNCLNNGGKMARLKNELTLKQRAFCNEYAKRKNAVEAYRSSYNTKASAKVASNNARALLAKPIVQDRVAKLLKQAETKAVLTAQQVLEEISEIATKPSVQTRDKLKALELMGKHRKLFTDKLELPGTGGLVVAWQTANQTNQDQAEQADA